MCLYSHSQIAKTFHSSEDAAGPFPHWYFTTAAGDFREGVAVGFPPASYMVGEPYRSDNV